MPMHKKKRDPHECRKNTSLLSMFGILYGKLLIDGTALKTQIEAEHHMVRTCSSYADRYFYKYTIRQDH